MESTGLLHAEDLKPGREVVLLHLGHLARPVVRRATALGRLTVFMPGIHGSRKSDWFQDAVKRGHLREFSFHPFKAFAEFWHADDRAFDAVEAVYVALKEGGLVPASVLTDLYGDTEVEVAFKNRLRGHLADFYQTLIAISLLSKEGVTVEFFPSAAWMQAGEWLNLAGVHWALPEAARVARGLRARLIKAESSLERLKWSGVLALLPAWVALGVRRVTWSAPLPRSAQVGIRVYASDWGFHGEGSCEIDWLLDGRQVHRENTLFVIEKPVSAKYRKEFEHRCYCWVDISGRNVFRRVSRRFLFGEFLGRGLKAWARLLIATTRAPGLFVEVAARGWLEYLRWTAFLEQWRPRHYVAYNHFHFEHLFRNACLRRVGCASWYYVDSIHDRCALYEGSPDRAIRSQEKGAYLGYDHEVHWGRRDEELYRRMRGSTRAYHVWGPLWSDHVRRASFVSEQIERRRSERKIDAIVAVFDTSFGSPTPYGESGALEFYDALAALLERPEWASRLLLFKPKLESEYVRAQVSVEAAASRERLLAHPRCLSLPAAKVAPGAAIAEADLTVSIAYTGTTVEALGARRRAFYFDPGGKFRDSYYDRFPDFVAHDREDLARLCERWLGMSDADFQKYLDHYLAPEFDGHLDLGAVARFRAALACD